MPIVSNGFTICPFPVNFDPYAGCAHQCKYCFANHYIREEKRDKFDASQGKGESVEQLKAFCEGKRTARQAWLDWRVPVCIGRMSDPFQPREAREHKTLECLKYLARTGYPFIVTTKGVMMAEEREYREVLKDCNCVFHISMVCPAYDKMEQGAPSYERRLNAVHILSGIVPRVFARWTPLFCEYTDMALPELRRQKEAGAYGIISGSAGLKRPVGLCNVRCGNQFFYPANLVERCYMKIRATCHALGLVFNCEEMKRLSDYLTCCIGAPMPGFTPCKCNAPFYWLARNEFTITPGMKKRGSGEAFQNFYTGRKSFQELKQRSFAQLMVEFCKKPTTQIQQQRG